MEEETGVNQLGISWLLVVHTYGKQYVVRMRYGYVHFQASSLCLVLVVNK